MHKHTHTLVLQQDSKQEVVIEEMNDETNNGNGWSDDYDETNHWSANSSDGTITSLKTDSYTSKASDSPDEFHSDDFSSELDEEDSIDIESSSESCSSGDDDSSMSSEDQWTSSEENDSWVQEHGKHRGEFLETALGKEMLPQNDSKNERKIMSLSRNRNQPDTCHKNNYMENTLLIKTELHKRNLCSKTKPVDAKQYQERIPLDLKQMKKFRREKTSHELPTKVASRTSRSKYSKPKGNVILSCFQHYHMQCPRLFTINMFLRVSILIWVIVQSSYYFFFQQYFDEDYIMKYASDAKFEKYLQRKRPDLSQDEIDSIKRRREKAATEALGSAAGRPSPKRIPRFSQVENIPPGCEYSEWQTQSFFTCNILHEYDLKTALGMKRFGPRLPDLNAENHGFIPTIYDGESAHYVGSGLWRNVWKVSNQIKDVPAVLKMMKMEHDIDQRNFDRHRRDALVMEQLTSNPNVVSAYGFCGNTVLTQLVGRGLDEIIFEPIKSKDLNPKFTRETPIERLKLALNTIRGLAALHQNNIIHADIQAKQFLIDETSGQVLLNDFNRCRFMGYNISSHETCPVRIPSAPGKCQTIKSSCLHYN